jgi:hypothetical protein
MTDYYHPIAERYYDIAVPTMLKLMGVEHGEKANNLFYRLRVSPRHAGANLLIFRKAD